ncbi:unnamed protein product, partial [Protopolystoma xenopodis]
TSSVSVPTPLSASSPSPSPPSLSSPSPAKRRRRAQPTAHSGTATTNISAALVPISPATLLLSPVTMVATSCAASCANGESGMTTVSGGLLASTVKNGSSPSSTCNSSTNSSIAVASSNNENSISNTTMLMVATPACGRLSEDCSNLGLGLARIATSPIRDECALKRRSAIDHLICSPSLLTSPSTQLILSPVSCHVNSLSAQAQLIPQSLLPPAPLHTLCNVSLASTNTFIDQATPHGASIVLAPTQSSRLTSTPLGIDSVSFNLTIL